MERNAKDIAKYINKCDKCQKNKIKLGNKEPLKLTQIPQSPFDKIVVDTIGPLSLSNLGNRYAVTIICDLTKYIVTASIPDKQAKSVARAIVNDFILIYGIPKQILSDLGTEYKNQILEEISEILQIKQSFSTANRHQTVGSIERNHRSFNEYLRAYIVEDQTN